MSSVPTERQSVREDEGLFELVGRLQASRTREVRLVLPAGAAFGQNPLNFKLLRDYAEKLGKVVVIESPDPAVADRARAAGLGEPGEDSVVTTPAAHPDDRPVIRMPASPAAESAGGPTVGSAAGVAVPVVASAVSTSAASGLDGEAEPAPRAMPRREPAGGVPPTGPGPAGARVSARPAAPRVELPSRAHRGAGWVLYTALATIALVALAALLVLVPSAEVTLKATPQAFSRQAEVVAEPGKPPVKMHSYTSSRSSSQSFSTTGLKITDATPASGTVVWSNRCSVAIFQIPAGQRVFGNGVTFATRSGVDVPPNGSAATPIVAVTPGASGNLPPGTITGIDRASDVIKLCLSVNNPEPTSGGADEKRDAYVTQTDLDTARNALQQAVQKEIVDDLSRQAAAAGEKLAPNPLFDSPQFQADRKVGDFATRFGASLNEKGSGLAYNEKDVENAFYEKLNSALPKGFTLVSDSRKVEYSVKGVNGSQITFAGTASGSLVPLVQADQVKSQLSLKPPSRALAYLKQQGFQEVTITQKPFALPFMPVLSSRISIKYILPTSGARPAAG